MRLRLAQKLTALLLLCGVLPLVAVSVLLIGIGRGQMEDSVRQVHRLEADVAAGHVTQFMLRVRNRLVMDLEGSIAAMTDQDVERAMVWMLGKHDNLFHFRVLRAHDERGIPIGGIVRLPSESIPEAQREKWLVEDADVAEFTRRLPLAEALATREAQVSPVYVNQRRREALVALSVPILDQDDQIQAVISGEVSLREVQRIIGEVAIGRSGFAYLVDSQGRAIAHPEFDRVRENDILLEAAIVEHALASGKAESASFTAQDGVPQLGASAPVFWGGWHLVVQQPEADAFRAVNEMKMRAAYILAVALLISLACGALYVRSLVVPLRKVMDGMRRIVDGQVDHRLDVATSDEIGELASAFNAMGKMLASSRREIEDWNRQLQARVEAKTKALESAQAQLIQSAKLSSLGQLGAGVAHELNNPLAGVVGQAALLKRRLKKIELPPDERERFEQYVAHIERESGRCREIIHGLLSFSQQSGTGTDRVDINETITKLLLLVHSNLRAAGVTVLSELGPEVPAVDANEHQLQQVLMHLTTNAQQAMPEGGTLTFATALAGDRVSITVKDTGRGIAPENFDKIFDPFFTTKDVWQSPGLGLSVCYSIVESHGGHIEVASTIGQGSSFIIHLPVSARHARAATRPAEPGALRRVPAPV